MSRQASISVAAIMVASLSTLFSSPADAQCSNADRCTRAICTQRQNRVHLTCDQARSCTGIPATNKRSLRRRLTINQRCAAVRINVARCFSVVDLGHRAAITQAQNAAALCQRKLNR